MKNKTFFKVMLRLIPMQFKAAPWWNTANLLLSVIHALTWTAGIIATKNLFDVISLAATGQISFADCVVPLLLLAAATFGQQIMNGINNFVAGIISPGIVSGKTAGHMSVVLQQKIQRIDSAFFEDPKFLTDLNKARESVPVISHFCMTLHIIIFYYGIYLASMGAYFFRLKPILIVTLLIAFIPALLAQFMRAKVFTNLEMESAPLRRESEYYQKTLCDREYFKETRILGAFKYFHKLIKDTVLILTKKAWKAEKKTSLLFLLLNTTTFAGMAASVYMLFIATMSGEISVGAFAAVLTALGGVFRLVDEVITMQIGTINRELGRVANYVSVLDMPEREGTDGIPDFSKGIVAEDVSFTYPGRENPAINGVSLDIAEGETIAVVGENGAGKSTLVRVLTGVYRPTGGRVIVGGLDTSKSAPESIFKGISGVFQQYQRYKMTLEENVAISDTKSAPSRSRIGSALNETDVEFDDKVELDTMLSPEFDGIDLSGGQWQRVAIARGLYRYNNFIVLDEPTSSIDPLEETKIYTQFQRLAKGKCAVIVTHRLGSARLAHRIIVMDGGRIVDTGTHKELLARPGKYADMWEVQAHWYVNDKISVVGSEE